MKIMIDAPDGKPATCIYREVLQMMDNLDWGGSVTGDNDSWQALKGWLTEQMDGGDKDEDGNEGVCDS